jgi:hypothetical protein
MFEKKMLKLFTQSPTRQGTNDTYPVNTSHRSPVCVKMLRPLYYLVGTVIHIKSPRRQTCVYMFFTIQRRLSGGKYRNWESSECRFPRKSFRVPDVRQLWFRVILVLKGLTVFSMGNVSIPVVQGNGWASGPI